jgi:DNA-binding IclR family transcriptional regulator
MENQREYVEVNMTERRQIKSIIKTAKILELFTQYRRELSLLEISQYMGLSKSTVHSLLATLLDLGYLRQNNENSKYSLGYKVISLAETLIKMTSIISVSKPYLYKLAFEVKETVHLAILSQREALYIDKIEPAERITVNSEIGRQLPVHCTAIGKVLLAHQDKYEVAKIIKEKGLKRYTDKTITDKEQLLKELGEIRKTGMGEDNEEIEEGLSCVAVPIYNHTEKVVAAISIAGPTARIESQRVRLIESIRKTADIISRELGYRHQYTSGM